MNRLLAIALVLAGCTELEPYGEAIIIADSDVPLSLAQELRVDVYNGRSEWIESQNFLLNNESDWPVSFSVLAPTDDHETDALVRLRLYPSGRLRDYRGERFETSGFEPLVPPHSMEEMCADPPVIVPGEVKRVRHTAVMFMDHLLGGTCSWVEMLGGSAALALEIAEEGDYRIGAVGTEPKFFPFDGIMLQLRRDCMDGGSWLDCEAAPPVAFGAHELPFLDIHLVPGRYYIVTGNRDPYVTSMYPLGVWDTVPLGPLDVRVGVSRVETWLDLDTREYVLEEPEVPPDALRVKNGPTPPNEPIPSMTVDRLVRLRLKPGKVGAARLVLRGECFGTMAKLRGEWPYQPPVLEEAETCVEVAGLREAVSALDLEDATEAPGASEWLGTFPQGVESCDAAELTSTHAVCVPGGVFLLGAPAEMMASVDERVAVMARFWIDRFEVTVGRWREAVARGLVLPSEFDEPERNEFALALSDVPTTDALCTYSDTPREREDFALNCIPWSGARAFCRFYGGDLPTQAQWEYAATAAGRSGETSLPWGDDPPRCSPEDCIGAAEPCHAAWIWRSHVPSFDLCRNYGFGPTSTASYVDAPYGDVSLPLNPDPNSTLFGLAGSLRELTLDAFTSYDELCWRSATLRNPQCWEEEAPTRVTHGSSWAGKTDGAYGSQRGLGTTSGFNYTHGFRCVYPARPIE